MNNDKLYKLINELMLGDKHATQFLINMAEMVRLADDLADGDSRNTAKDMSQLLYRAIIANNSNPFFNKHKDALSAAIANSIGLWAASEEWKKSENEKTRMFSFVYREGVEHILHTCALLVGGFNHAVYAIETFHKETHQASQETFNDWEKENGSL